MRPYLAIIKDSFKAALASRVLYVLLGLILLFLLAIAPLHVRESLDTSILLDRDVRLSDQGLLAQRMKEMLANDNKPMQRIWDQLPTATQRKIDLIAGGQSNKNSSGLNEAIAAELVVSDLNQMIKDPQFYRQQDWSDGNYNSETQNLLRDGADSLTVLQQQRLNRLLISQSFGGMISTGSQSALNFYYGPFDWSGYLSEFFITNMSHGQFASQFSSLISWFLDKIVLSIGLLIAILVTANIVPQTFEAGTLNLLLSKPVSRSGLFLAKFVGGCMFIALCAVVLFVGLWIWMGIGLGIWDRSVLLSIPLYVIVFAIYYSVSSLTGLVTRSTILSIIATGIFWAACWSVGTLYGFFNGQMEANEIISMTLTAQGPLVSTGSLPVPQSWNSRQSEWMDANLPALDEEERLRMGTAMMASQMMGLDELPFPKSIGPTSNKDGSLTVYGRVLASDTSTHLKRQCFVAKSDGDFQRRGVFPSGVVTVFAAGDELLCVNSRGRFYRFDPDKEVDNASDRQTWFVSAGPTKRSDIGDARQVAIDDQTQQIAIYNEGTIAIYAIDEEDENRNYKQVQSAEINTGARKSMSCQLAWQGDLILLALGNGQVIFVDAASLETKHSYLPETRVAIDSISASPDGRWFSLLYKDETLRLFDADNPSIERAPIRGQGSISAVAFDASSMIVADRTDRVTEYSIGGFSETKTWSPSPTWMQKVWRYGIKPLYWVFPKPGEFYKVVAHLSSSNDSQHNPNVDLSLQPVRPNPWSPLASGLKFMALMLAISCFVFSRTDY